MKMLIAAMLTIAGLSSFAQQPVITSVDKRSAGNQDIVTIKGSGFGTDATKLVVFFGAARATLNAPPTDQLLEVKVPAGATYEKISVTNTNTTSGLTAYAHDNFLLTYGGNHGFDATTQLEGQKDFTAPNDLYDICLCDFNSDGKTDVATANSESSSIQVLVNNTTATGINNISFSYPAPLLINANTLMISCGDLNGDGKPDMVLSEEGDRDRIFVLQNTTTGTGTPTFSAPKIIRITGEKVYRTKIADLDGDGKPEIVVTSKTTSDHDNNTATPAIGHVFILVNQSTTSTISFASTPIKYVLNGNSSALAIEDFNDDGLPEIVTTQYYSITSRVLIIHNTSTPGNVSLGSITAIPFDRSISELKVGDLDNDGKPEIAATLLINSEMRIVRNESSGNTIAFSAPVTIVTQGSPYGIDFGDLDGDGKPDIVVASIEHKFLTVLNNTSTPGNLSFVTSFRPTTYIHRYLTIGDIDGDAKPDITFVSADNETQIASKVSILRNTACIKPKITPEGPLDICLSRLPFKLSSSVSPGATYIWKETGTGGTVQTGPGESYNVTAAGNYSFTVTLTAEGGACALTSDPVTVAVSNGNLTGYAKPGNNGPVCAGNALQLTAATGIGATRYRWTGPENFSYEDVSPTPPPIANFREAKAGKYRLEVIVGTCVAKDTFTVVNIIDVPEFKINTGGSTVACIPATKTLSINPAAGFTYQWFRDGASIPSASGASYTTNTSGNYHVEAAYAGCTNVQSDPVSITFATAPTVLFTAPSTACMGQNITFTNQSVTDPAVTATTVWDFGDGNTSSDASPVHKYSTASTFTARLTVSYSNGACATTMPKTITIQSAPVATISSAGNKFSFCPGDSLRLEVTGPFTSYSWSTGATTQSVYVKSASIYSVDVTTTTGCTINATREVKLFNEPEVIITAAPTEVAEGQSAVLTATGLQNYLWTPADALSSATVSNPTASPLVTTTYTVKGTDTNGCKGEAVIELRVREGSIYSKISPSKFFSPDNGDEFGKFWLVDRIEEYPGCQISVYDDKGIKVHEAKPYHNDWDGTFNGRQLPDGVYYFVIKCEGETTTPKTGSITLLR